MVSCTLCSSEMNEDGQCYLFDNMGPNIISTIENDLGHEVNKDSTICANCFANIMHKMSVPTPADTMTYQMSPPPHEEQQHTNVCVWCQSSLHKRRAHALPEGPERRLISERISPQKILDGSLVCHTCWV